MENNYDNGNNFYSNVNNYDANNINYNDSNNLNVKRSNKKIIGNVIGASVFVVILATIGCGYYYVKNTGRTKLDSILPISGESYSFDNTDVTEGNIETVTDVSSVVESVMPSVVAITETSVVQGYQNFFGYYGGQEEVQSGSGSGIIVGEDEKNYYVVTNNHVIDGADKIEVSFVDDEIVEASVKGTDASNDLAIVSVEKKAVKDTTKKKIKIATMGESDELRVGENVIAIGNSLGYGQSVTYGYISALDREVELETGIMEAIQTDAAINPGNSGGALLNMKGEVIGINSAKLAAEEVEGMGFAIAISKAKPILDKLITKKIVDDVDKGYFGITGRTVTEDEIEVLSYKKGVFVVEVLEDGGAKKAGMLQGDIITKVNDEKVTTIEGLLSTLESYKKGETVEVVIYRNTAGKLKKKVLKVTLAGQEVIETEEEKTTSEFN